MKKDQDFSLRTKTKKEKYVKPEVEIIEVEPENNFLAGSGVHPKPFKEDDWEEHKLENPDPTYITPTGDGWGDVLND